MTTDPGWYPDEEDPRLARYWDGSAWTDRTKPQAEVKASVLDRRVSMKTVLVGVGALLGIVASGVVGVVVLGGDDSPDAETASTVAPSTITSSTADVTTTVSAGVEPMTAERLLNVELPDLTAEDGFRGGQLVDGTLSVDEFETLTTSEAAMYLGDITGDGVDDGLVKVTLEFEGGNNFAPADLYLFDSSGEFLDVLHNSELGGSSEFPTVDGDTLTFEVLSLGPDDPRCCPSVETTVYFRWNGTEFEPA